MRKIMYVLFLMLFGICSIVSVEASGSIELLVSEKVEGNVGVPLQETIYVFTKDEEFKFVDIEEGDDVTSWLNLPSGCLEAKVVSILDDGYKLKIEVKGTPQEECDDNIIVTVPAGHIENYMLEGLSNNPIEDVVYDITYLPVICYYTEPSTIEGIVDEELNKQYVYIKVEGDNIDIGIEGTTLAHVNGMDAICEYLDLDENTISVYFIGTPEHESHDLVDLTLPAGSLETNTELSLHVPFRDDVKYDINPRKPEPKPDPEPEPEPEPEIEIVYVVPYTGVE